MASCAPPMRRTRIVCVSDTHNAAPGGPFKLPRGDVLIHAGDMTNQGSFKELQRTVQWIEEADFECKIVIAGNHDISLDTGFYSQYGSYFHNQELQDPAKCQELLECSPSILWLKHEAATVKLASADGPRTTFKIFGSPFSPSKGMWAFGYGTDEARNTWDRIPLDSDIVVTHTPAQTHCDETKQRRAEGCEELRNVLWRVRPRLAICGHVHDGRGSERILWDLGNSNTKFKELCVKHWIDPGAGNKKTSLVDLSAKGGFPLQNDGAVGDWIPPHECTSLESTSVQQRNIAFPELQSSKLQNRSSSRSPQRREIVEQPSSCVAAGLMVVPSDALPVTSHGQGGIPPSGRCDLEALSGRMGRCETCIVNAAMMASSYPHKTGKRYNKPIVVDIDLPMWEI